MDRYHILPLLPIKNHSKIKITEEKHDNFTFKNNKYVGELDFLGGGGIIQLVKGENNDAIIKNV